MGAFDLFTSTLIEEDKREEEELQTLLTRLKTDLQTELEQTQRATELSPASAKALARTAENSNLSLQQLKAGAEGFLNDQLRTTFNQEFVDKSRSLQDERRSKRLRTAARLDRIKELEARGVSRLFEDYQAIPSDLGGPQIVQTGTSPNGTPEFRTVPNEQFGSTSLSEMDPAQKITRAQEVANFLDLPRDLVLDRLEEEQEFPEVVGRAAERAELQRNKEARELQDSRLVNFYADNPELLPEANLSKGLLERVNKAADRNLTAAQQKAANKLLAKETSQRAAIAKKLIGSGDYDLDTPEGQQQLNQAVDERFRSIAQAATFRPEQQLETVTGAHTPVSPESRSALVTSVNNLLRRDPLGIGAFGSASSVADIYRTLTAENRAQQLQGLTETREAVTGGARRLADVATSGLSEQAIQGAEQAGGSLGEFLQSFRRDPTEPSPAEQLRSRLPGRREPGEETDTVKLLRQLGLIQEDDTELNFEDIGSFFGL